MDILQWVDPSIDQVVRQLALLTDGDLSRPTPCAEWDVHRLVDHVVRAFVGVRSTLEGAELSVIGRLEAPPWADLAELGVLVATESKRMADSFREPGALDRVTCYPPHQPNGAALLDIWLFESVVHSWDFARSVGGDDTPNDELVDVVIERFPAHLEFFRSVGFLGDPEPGGGTPMERLLRLAGRRP